MRSIPIHYPKNKNKIKHFTVSRPVVIYIICDILETSGTPEGYINPLGSHATSHSAKDHISQLPKIIPRMYQEISAPFSKPLNSKISAQVEAYKK